MLDFEQGHNEAIQFFDMAKSETGLLRRKSPSKPKGFAPRNDGRTGLTAFTSPRRGEVGAQRRVRGLSPVESMSPLTPTLSSWEREPAAVVRPCAHAAARQRPGIGGAT